MQQLPSCHPTILRVETKPKAVMEMQVRPVFSSDSEVSAQNWRECTFSEYPDAGS